MKSVVRKQYVRVPTNPVTSVALIPPLPYGAVRFAATRGNSEAAISNCHDA